MRNVKDNMDSIFQVLKESGITMKHGGGTGLYFGEIRPSSSIIRSNNSTPSGPVSFMETFDTSCGTIKAGNCLEGDARIHTDKGLIPIREIVETKDEYRVLTHKGYKKILSKFNNGLQDVVKVTLDNGQILPLMTKNHEIMYLDNGKLKQKPISDFNIGERVLFIREEFDLENYKNNGSLLESEDFNYFFRKLLC